MTIGIQSTGQEAPPDEALTEAERAEANKLCRDTFRHWELSETRCDWVDLVMYLNGGIMRLVRMLREHEKSSNAG